VSGDFVAAYAGGSVAQAALVAGGSMRCAPRALRGLRHPLFALIPLVALVGVVFGLRAAPEAAGGLAKLALLLVPLLALVAAARIGPFVLVAAVGLVALTLRDGHSLAGQLGALALIGGSCTVLGALLVEVTPPRWLGVGIALTALADLILVSSGLLAPASATLNAAGVTGSLPQLQRVELGPMTMGYADLFLPALVGALLATRARPRRWVAALTLCFALVAVLVFLVANELPATVPVALALLVVEAPAGLRALRRRCSAAVSGAPPHARRTAIVRAWQAAGAWAKST
jgi:hypothetical protein